MRWMRYRIYLFGPPHCRHGGKTSLCFSTYLGPGSGKGVRHSFEGGRGLDSSFRIVLRLGTRTETAGQGMVGRYHCKQAIMRDMGHNMGPG
jgi:hypothetical protein